MDRYFTTKGLMWFYWAMVGVLTLLIAYIWFAPKPAQAQFVPVQEVVGKGGRSAPVTFSCGLNNIAATLTECKAVPTDSAVSYYITDVVVQSSTTTTGTFAIQSGTGTNCGTATTALFPVSGAANRFSTPPTSNGPHHFKLNTPIKLTAGHAICAIGAATNTLNAQIMGYQAK